MPAYSGHDRDAVSGNSGCREAGSVAASVYLPGWMYTLHDHCPCQTSQAHQTALPGKRKTTKRIAPIEPIFGFLQLP